MVAPQRPTDAEPWTAPPPGSVVAPPPRRWRTPVLAAAAVLAVVVVAVTAGALLRDTSDPAASQPAEDEPVESVDRPTEEDPDTDADVDPELARLRASDRYLAIAEHQRASVAVSPIPGDTAWEIFRPAEGQYANKEALWDDVVGPIRDDALLSGNPYADAMWNENRPAEAYMPSGWHDETTRGRGDAFSFAFRFVDPATGEPVERTHAVLIRSDAEGSGEVAARMDSFDLRRGDAPGFLEAGDLADERVRSWIQQHPAEGTPE